MIGREPAEHDLVEHLRLPEGLGPAAAAEIVGQEPGRPDVARGGPLRRGQGVASALQIAGGDQRLAERTASTSARAFSVLPCAARTRATKTRGAGSSGRERTAFFATTVASRCRPAAR